MTPTLLETSTPEGEWDLYDRIADALAGPGYIRLGYVVPEDIYAHLIRRSRQLKRCGAYRRAGVGRDREYRLSGKVRGDGIHWLRRDQWLEAGYLDWMETMRLELNRRLFLGLFDYEAHFALYRPGAFYRRHLDAFRGQSNRRVSTVLYLNSDWSEHDGGELLIYPEHGDSAIERVLPNHGVMLVFLSEQVPHEVLPARRDRFSIAGWFRINASLSERVDPAR